jgi:DNA-binding transcriptional LysR family regulator
MDVNSLQLFACIVEGGNLSAAARTLKMTRSNVSRRLRALESAVGMPLMRRTTHEVSLTSAGEMLYARARNIAREVAAAQAELCGRGAGARGRLRVAIPRSISQFALASVLTQFSLDHPGAAIEVLYSNDVRDLHTERIDVAIRIARQPIESAVVVWRSEVEQAICASLDYLQAHGFPDSPASLAKHRIITYATRAGVIPLIASLGNVHERVILDAHVRANDLEFVRTAACSGLGIALLARYALDSAVLDGRLVELLPEYSFNLNRSKLYLQAMEARYQAPLAKLLLLRMKDALQRLPLTRTLEEKRAAA